MKLKNYDYVLFLNVVITGLLQINNFSVVGLISVILSLVYLGIKLFSKFDHKLIIILFATSTLLGLIYYLINPLFNNSSISWYSLVPALLLIILIIHAITMPYIKRNSFSGVKTPLALKNDEVWEKVNYLGSICFYAFLFPLYITIFYFEGSAKIFATFAIVVLAVTLTLALAFNFERQYRKQIVREEQLLLQKQRTKETSY